MHIAILHIDAKSDAKSLVKSSQPQYLTTANDDFNETCAKVNKVVDSFTSVEILKSIINFLNVSVNRTQIPSSLNLSVQRQVR